MIQTVSESQSGTDELYVQRGPVCKRLEVIAEANTLLTSISPFGCS